MRPFTGKVVPLHLPKFWLFFLKWCIVPFEITMACRGDVVRQWDITLKLAKLALLGSKWEQMKINDTTRLWTCPLTDTAHNTVGSSASLLFCIFHSLIFSHSLYCHIPFGSGGQWIFMAVHWGRRCATILYCHPFQEVNRKKHIGCHLSVECIDLLTSTMHVL